MGVNGKKNLGELNALPKNGEPIISSNWNDQDEAFRSVAKGIGEIVKKNQKFTSPEPKAPISTPPTNKKAVSNFKIFRNWKIYFLSTVMLLAWVPAAQPVIIEVEQSFVAFWRVTTQQFPSKDKKIVLIHIDNDSLNAADIQIKNRRQLDRFYLARLIKKLEQIGAKNIGIDYLLDTPSNYEADKYLADTVKSSVKSTKFILASSTKNGKEINISPNLKIDYPASITQGNIDFTLYFGELNNAPYKFTLWTPQTSSPTPFSYWLAMMQKHPNAVSANNDIREELINNGKINFASIENEQAYSWLQTVIDYSVPPDFVYERIPAQQLLNDSMKIDGIKNKVFLIAPGGYPEAGIDRNRKEGEVEKKGQDNFNIPLAIRFRLLGELKNAGVEYFRGNRPFTGGEVHAYMTNQLLNKSLVRRFPDIIIVFAAIIFAGIFFIIETAYYRNKNYQGKESSGFILLIINFTFIILCLFMYCDSGLFLPWIYPSISTWVMRSMLLDKSLSPTGEK
jgi:CHASE2 domain-containing sensor protein